MNNNLNENLKNAIEASGLSVAKFAEMMGVDRQSAYGWLRGSNMTIDNLFKASAILETTADILLVGDKVLDTKLLSESVAIVELALDGRVVKPCKKAELIAYVYDQSRFGAELRPEDVRRIISMMVD